MTDLDLTALSEALTPGALVTDPAAMDIYRRDHSAAPVPGRPAAVVRAANTADVQATLRFASARCVPVVPRGAGSGLSGGSTAVDGAIVLSLDRMADIQIDPDTHTARVRPGAMNAAVKAAAAEHGLWYPPDPSSFEFCSIGGNVATNAGGLCCVKYGVTGDYVLGMTVVLADGRAVTLGGPRVKDVAGLSLAKLFVGSEGTLGVICEVVLRLVPAGPAPVTLVATFADVDDAVRAVVAVTARMRPAMLELMDRTTINAVEDMTRMGLDREAGAMLVIQSDAPGAQAAADLAVIDEICTAHGATECYAAEDAEQSEAFVTARRVAVLAVEKKGTLLLEDAGVPLPALGDLVRGIGRIAADRRTLVALVAHAGDGNTHPMIVFDAADPDAAARARDTFDDIMRLAIDLGGTITGEHGVGRLKAPWLRPAIGEAAYALTRTIKDALDPAGILNPGVLLAD